MLLLGRGQTYESLMGVGHASIPLTLGLASPVPAVMTACRHRQNSAPGRRRCHFRTIAWRVTHKNGRRFLGAVRPISALTYPAALEGLHHRISTATTRPGTARRLFNPGSCPVFWDRRRADCCADNNHEPTVRYLFASKSLGAECCCG
jgi:hypothetical protein